MSARQVTCFIAVCNGCEEEYEHDYTPHWPTAGQAIDDAVDGGDWWSDEETTLLCPSCVLKPHAFVEGTFDASDCLRCNIPVDEHESVPDDA